MLIHNILVYYVNDLWFKYNDKPTGKVFNVNFQKRLKQKSHLLHIHGHFHQQQGGIGICLDMKQLITMLRQGKLSYLQISPDWV
ncbi:MAG: hypothetical protein COW63_06580 [Bacteroidetes bacterium CG18_big_fil_WC_8_21_14_2_50_41_14]|nr:MAG: hypothetical protein COW63_06580 [Bacteroidetes bacterium CG18_big_fil_WC_8_21_14_2_50_41_14]PJB59143.1 MAG: hypothetical protein CO098_05000 [Bacteroidetes bacterium CG_4_9_14_3_um_filter_41_19]